MDSGAATRTVPWANHLSRLSSLAEGPLKPKLQPEKFQESDIKGNSPFAGLQLSGLIKLFSLHSLLDAKMLVEMSVPDRHCRFKPKIKA